MDRTLKTGAHSGIAFGAEDNALSVYCEGDGEAEDEGFEGRHCDVGSKGKGYKVNTRNEWMNGWSRSEADLLDEFCKGWRRWDGKGKGKEEEEMWNIRLFFKVKYLLDLKVFLATVFKDIPMQSTHIHIPSPQCLQKGSKQPKTLGLSTALPAFLYPHKITAEMQQE
jgi:hypothetical protein